MKLNKLFPIGLLTAFFAGYPSSLSANDPYHHELHFSVNLAGVYGITKTLEAKGIPGKDSIAYALSIMTFASLYKEYVYDSEPEGMDLVYDALGMLTACMVIRF